MIACITGNILRNLQGTMAGFSPLATDLSVIILLKESPNTLIRLLTNGVIVITLVPLRGVHMFQVKY